MGFMEAHLAWLQDHLRRRTGERRDRLKRGHKHAEQLFLKLIWWPLFGHFKGLHPEYEVADWRGMKYFVDLMWCMGNIRIAFEIKGYGPHVEQADRTKYKRELTRELFLQGMGAIVVSIPYDELEENPALIRTLVQMIIAPYLKGEQEERQYTRLERELMKLAARTDGVVRPIEASRELEIDYRTAVKYLRQLCEKGKFREITVGRTGKIRRYEFKGSYLDDGLR